MPSEPFTGRDGQGVGVRRAIIIHAGLWHEPARAIPTFTEPVELLQPRACSFVWFRLNRKRSNHTIIRHPGPLARRGFSSRQDATYRTGHAKSTGPGFPESPSGEIMRFEKLLRSVAS